MHEQLVDSGYFIKRVMRKPYPEVFRRNSRAPLVVPSDVRPDPIPKTFQSLGFDSVSRSMESVLGFECSPLSCNSMASEWHVNERCLFPSLELALAGADRFATDQPEPEDYYVVEVLEEVLNWMRRS